MEISRGSALGVFPWSRTARSPVVPATFSANPDQVALGQALALRVTAATNLTAQAIAAAGLLELAWPPHPVGRWAPPGLPTRGEVGSAAGAARRGQAPPGGETRRFAKLIYDVHNLTTRAVARFLVTGQGTSETERRFLKRLGITAAAHGLSVVALTRSYLLWRDTNLRVLNEEAARLGTAPAVAEEARMIIRSSADTGILRIAGAYDDQMHSVVRNGATPIALHSGRPRLNGRASAEAEVVRAVRSLA